MFREYPYRELEDFLKLEENWDGYDGKVPKLEVVETAKDFLRVLQEHGINSPNMFVDNGGEVVFSWEKHGNYLEVFFDTANQFSFYTEINGEFYGEDEYCLEQIPESSFFEHIKSFEEDKKNSDFKKFLVSDDNQLETIAKQLQKLDESTSTILFQVFSSLENGTQELLDESPSTILFQVFSSLENETQELLDESPSTILFQVFSSLENETQELSDESKWCPFGVLDNTSIMGTQGLF